MNSQTYSISGGGFAAEICPENGAGVFRLRCGGEDVLIPFDPEKHINGNPYLYGTPLLFPANRTHRGQFTFEGKTYTLTINEPVTDSHLHGLLHREAFNLVFHEHDRIVMRYENCGKIYPFLFAVQAEYRTGQEGFTQEYVISNSGERNMPLTFALHTTFCEPAQFSVPLRDCQQKNERHIPTGQYVPLNEKEQRCVTGSPSMDVELSGYYRSAGHTAYIGRYTYTVSDNFDYWILFNGKGKSGLLCVEPQCGAVYGLNIPDSCPVLRPGESIRFVTCIASAKAE